MQDESLNRMMSVGEAYQRIDSWVNAFTAMGTGRDRSTYTMFQPSAPLLPQELGWMYANDDLIRVIVDAYPEAALRSGFEIQCDTPEWQTRIEKECKRLEVLENLTDSDIWGSLFGGALLWIASDDGLDPRHPLSTIGPVRFLEIVDRRNANPEPSHVLDPCYYEVYPVEQGQANWPELNKGCVQLHKSRVVRCGGARTDKQSKLLLNGWDWSILQAEIETIKGFQEMFYAARCLLNDASQAVLKLKGLLAALAGGKRDDLLLRAQLLDMTRGIARSIILDADSGESFERHTQTFAGVADLLAIFARRLSAATGIPVTVLMGQAPAGLNATGDTDMRIFYDRVQAYRTQRLEPRLMTLLIRIARGIGYDGPLSIKWPSLWQETPKELAERKKLTADTDKIYLDAEVITPEEVAENRFPPGGWSDQMKIDLEHRRGEYLQPPGAGQPAPPAQQ